MPRIRKKTSKRGTSHQRSKIKQKVAESHKKAKRAAKKDPQWKSKHKKDPGIPNNFPYKDQILAEVAAQRRQEEEEKQRRKEAKKVRKGAAAKGDAEREEEEDASGFDGVTSVGMSALKVSPSSKAASTKGKEKADAMEEDEDVPILMNSEYANLKAVLDKADIVLQILDARDPQAFRSLHLQEHAAKSKKARTMFVLNKIDTCPREATQAWAIKLRAEHPTFLFRSSSTFLPKTEEQKKGSTGKNKPQSTNDAVGLTTILQALGKEANKKKEGDLFVAVVGVANSGKSSLVNSLIKKSISPIYKLTSSPPTPSTSERAVEVTLEYEGKTIHLVDTPALSWERVAGLEEDAIDLLRAKDMLLRNKGRLDKAKEPVAPLENIVSRANNEDLMLFYNLPAFAKGDTIAFLSALARRHNLVKKHGELDLTGAARIVLRDWSTGKFPWFTQLPPSADSSKETDAEFADLYTADAEILEAAPTRKDMRRGDGLVKLTPGSPEERRAALEAPWDEPEDNESESEDEIEVDAAINGLSEDEDEDGEGTEDDIEVDEEEEEPEEPPVVKGKRKRKEKSGPSPAAKKVAFAPHPKGTKQSRAQSSPKSAPKAAPSGKPKKGRK